MKIEFEKQFGKGTDPWYAKAERWVKKKFKNPFLQHLGLGFIAWLKEKWVEGKIDMEMSSVDSQIEKLHEDWDEEEKNKKSDSSKSRRRSERRAGKRNFKKIRCRLQRSSKYE